MDEYAECINRERAINEFAIRSSFYDAEWGNKRFTLDDIEEILQSIPAADVAPVRHGRWKRVDPRSTVVTFRCSECNYYAHMNATNFCPNCGADMREVQDA